MIITAVGIFWKDNQPLIIKTKFDYQGNQDEQEAEKVKQHFLLKSSLDSIIDIENSSSKSTTTGPAAEFSGQRILAARDPYLGLLTQTETHRVYGMMSTTRVKVMIVISVNPDEFIR